MVVRRNEVDGELGGDTVLDDACNDSDEGEGEGNASMVGVSSDLLCSTTALVDSPRWRPPVGSLARRDSAREARTGAVVCRRFE